MNNLKKIRTEKGLSQIQLAAKAGVSTSTISLIENSEIYKPNSSTLKAIAHALNISVDKLIGD
jgi:transcriptional regulator with XRE-family HTH domain